MFIPVYTLLSKASGGESDLRQLAESEYDRDSLKRYPAAAAVKLTPTDLEGQQLTKLGSLKNQTTPHSILSSVTDKPGSVPGPEAVLQVGLSTLLKERFPHFMIIGFGKAGTRALYDTLRLHPQLDGPKSEERFFTNKYAKGLKKYLSSFPSRPLGGFLIEKSPDYILNSNVPPRIVSAVRNMGRNVRDLMFVVVTRSPVDRAMSEYLEWQVQRKLSKSEPLPLFDDMVLRDDGLLQTQQPFINASCYEYHIRRWLRTFSEAQMCYVDGDAFVTNPLQQIHQLETCMGLHNYFSDENFVFNEKRGFYCFQTTESDTKCMGGSKGRPHPPIATEVKSQLTRYFQQCNSQISQFTGFEINY